MSTEGDNEHERVRDDYVASPEHDEYIGRCINDLLYGPIVIDNYDRAGVDDFDEYVRSTIIDIDNEHDVG